LHQQRLTRIVQRAKLANGCAAEINGDEATAGRPIREADNNPKSATSPICDSRRPTFNFALNLDRLALPLNDLP